MNTKMTAQEIDAAVDAEIAEKFARKPMRWEECETIRLSDLSAKVQNWILDLPRYIGPEKPLENLAPSVVERLGQYHIRETANGRRYLIDSQGASYARYAVEIQA